MRPDAVLETCLYVDDLAAADRFYGEVLGLERIASEPDRHVFYRCGPGVLLVFLPERTAEPGATVGGSPIPSHGAQGPGHAALRVAPESRDRWRAHLADRGVELESEVDWPGGGWSLYFRDPAGNSLELATGSLWGLDR
jgi:catechol 2,3-dioxygenase-like lactoylglutathione lyase family enzyme